MSGLEDKFRENPGDTIVFRELEHLYQSQSAWEKLAGIYCERANFLKKVEIRESAQLFLQAGRSYQHRLNDFNRAYAAFEQAFELDVESDEIFIAIEDCCLESERWQDLAQIYQERLEILEDNQIRLELLKKSAHICESKLEQYDQAITLYLRAKSQSPKDMDILRHLATLFEKQSHWKDAIDIWLTLLKMTESQEARDRIYLQVANLWEKVGDRERAVSYYRNIIESSCQEEAFAHLEQLYMDSPEDLALILLEKLESIKEDHSRAKMYKKLASLQENKEGAITYYQRALEINSHDIPVLKKISQIFWEKGQVNVWFEYQMRIFGNLDSTGHKIELLRESSEILRDNGQHSELLIKIYQLLLKESPEDRMAIEELLKLYREIKDSESLVKLLVHKSKHCSLAEKITTYAQIARVLSESLNQQEEANDYYRKALDLRDDHSESLDNLQEQYLKNGKYNELLKILEKKIEAEPNAATGYYYEMGKIYRDLLDNADKGIECFKKSIELDPRHWPAFEALLPLLHSKSMWDHYLKVAEEGLLVIKDLNQAISLHLSIAEVYAKQGQWQIVEEHLLTILRHHPSHSQALEKLADIYQKQNRWQNYLEIQEAIARFSINIEQLPELYYEIARVYKEKLQQKKQALHYYEKANYLAPFKEKYLESLQETAQELSDQDRMIYCLEERAKICKQPERSVQLLSEIGKICRTKGDYQGAIEVYTRAYDISPASLDIVDNLIELYHHLKKENLDLLLLLRRKTHLLKDEKQLPDIYRETACLARSLGKHSVAIEFMEKLLETTPDDHEVLEQLADLYHKEKNWNALLDIYRRQLVDKTPEEKLVILQKMADIYQEHEQDWWELQNIYEDMLRTSPGHQPTIENLQKVCRKIENWRGLAACYRHEIDHCENTEHLAELYQELGEIYYRYLPEPDKAIECYRQVFQYDPDNYEIHEHLHQLYMIKRDYQHAVEILDHQLTLLEDPEMEGHILVEKGLIYRDRLHDEEKSIETFEKALSVCPALIEAMEALESLFRRRKQYEKLLELLKNKYAVVSEEAGLELQVEIARIYADCLKKYEEAENYLTKTIDQQPTHREAGQRLVNYYYKTKNWEGLKKLYQKQLAGTSSEEDKSENLFILGKLYEEKLDDCDQAATYYVQALNLSPGNLPVIQSLQKIYQYQDKAELLIEAYFAELATTEIALKRRITLHQACAEIYDSKLNQQEQAIKHYQQVLQLSKNDLFAIRRLQSLYRSSKDYQELVAALQQELTIEKQEKRLLAIYLELAQIYLDKIHTPEESIKHAIAAYRYRPEHCALKKYKESLRKNKHWPQYIAYLKEEMRQSDQKQDYYLELGNIYYEHLKDDSLTIENFEKAYQYGNVGLESLQKLEILYNRQENPSPRKLADLYEAQKKLLVNREKTIALCRKLGVLYEKELESSQKSSECWEEILILAPENEEAHAVLAKLYMKLQKWQSLAHILSERAWLAKSQEQKIKYLCQAAGVWEKKLSNYDKAAGYYQMILTIDFDNIKAIKGLRRISEKKQDWQSILDILYREIDNVDSSEHAALYLKIARIWEKKLHSINQAVETYLKVLKIKFHHETAAHVLSLLKSIKGYESFCRLARKVVRYTKDPSIKAKRLCDLGQVLFEELNLHDEAIKAFEEALKCVPQKIEAICGLEQIYQAGECWAQLADCKRRKLELTTQRSEIKQIHLELGEIAKNYLYDEKKAIFHFERVFELNEEDIFIVRTLQQLYYGWGYFDKYIKMCLIEIEKTEDKERKVDLYLAIANTRQEKLFDEDQATEDYEKILELDADNEKAATALEYLLKKKENFERLIAFYNTRIKACRNKEKSSVPLLLASGKILLNELKNYKEAEKIYKEVLKEQEKNNEALTALSKIFHLNEDVSQLAEVIKIKIEKSCDSQKKADLYYRLGKLYQKAPDMQEQTIHAYRQAMEIMPKNSLYINALQDVYRQENQTEQIIKLNNQLIEWQENENEKIAILLENAELTIGNEHIAEDYLQKILDLVPHHQQALKLLAQIQKNQERWQELIETLQIRISHETNISQQSELLVIKGKLWLEQLADKEKALADFQLALDKKNDNRAAVLYLADLHWQKQNWHEAEMYCRQIMYWPDEVETEDRGLHGYRWAKTAEIMEQPQVAIVRYQKVLSLVPESLDVLMALGKIYYDNKQWEQALLIYMKLNGLPLDDQNKTEVQFHLSVIKDQMGMTEGAIEGYLQVLAENPKDILALEALGILYFEKEEHEKVLEYFEKLYQLNHSPENSKKALIWLAKIYEEIGKPEQAIENYQKRLQHDKDDREIRKKLLPLMIKNGKIDEALEQIEQLFKTVTTPLEQAELNVMRGRLYMADQETYEKSLSFFEAALEKFPAYSPAMEAVSELYGKTQKWQELLEFYRNILKRCSWNDDEHSIPILLKKAEVLEKQLHDFDQAINLYQKILSIDPEHIGSHAVLAYLLAKRPDNKKEAIIQFNYLLLHSPFASAYYRNLFELYLDQKQYDKSYLCCQALNALNNINEEEKEFLARVPARMFSAWLEPKSIDYLIKEKARGTLYEIMASVDSYLDKIYPPALEEKYGVRKKDRWIPGTDQREPGPSIESIMRVLGIQELYYYTIDGREIFLENTSVPCLIIGRDLLQELSLPQIRFVIGRLLFYVSRKHVMAVKLSKTDYQKYIYRLVEGFAETGKKLSTEEESVSRRLRQALPRKTRKQLEERMDILTEIYHADTENFLMELQSAADKCGLLFCDSLKDALLARNWLNKEKSPEKWDREMEEFFWFNLSQEHGRLRSELGIAVKWIR